MSLDRIKGNETNFLHQGMQSPKQIKSKAETKTSSFLDVIPKDVILDIFSYLGAFDLVHLAQTSKKANQICNDPLIWKSKYLWKYPNIFSEINDQTVWKTASITNEALEKVSSFGTFQEIPTLLSKDIYDIDQRWMDYNGKTLAAFSHKRQNYIFFEFGKEILPKSIQKTREGSAIIKVETEDPQLKKDILCVRFIKDCLVKAELHHIPEKKEKHLFFSDRETNNFYKLTIPFRKSDFSIHKDPCIPFHFEIIEDNLFFVQWADENSVEWRTSLHQYKIDAVNKTLTPISETPMGEICHSWIISGSYFITVQEDEILCYDWKKGKVLGTIKMESSIIIKMEIIQDSLYVLSAKELTHYNLINLEKKSLVNISTYSYLPEWKLYTCFKIVGSTAFLFGKNTKHHFFGESPNFQYSFTQIRDLKTDKHHLIEQNEIDCVKEALIVNGSIITIQHASHAYAIQDPSSLPYQENMLTIRNFKEIQTLSPMLNNVKEVKSAK